MNEQEIIEKVEQRIIQEFGYIKEHVSREKPTFMRYSPDIVVSLWKTLFFIEVKTHLNPKDKELLIARLNEHANEKKIPYFVIVAYNLEGLNNWHVYKSNAKKAVQVDISALYISNFTPRIGEIDSYCFQYLQKRHEEDENFTFQLDINTRMKSREKWYFFSKNGDSCRISFWDGEDWRSKSPNIYISIDNEGFVSLILTAKDSDTKAKFLNQVAELVGAKLLKIKDEQNSVWVKIYSYKWLRNYLDVLGEFIRIDKEIIDAQIFKEKLKQNNNLGNIDFVSVENFKEKYKKKLILINKIEDSYRYQVVENEEKKDIKFISIILQNISMFKSFSMDLSNRITCIIGDNGTGKTTLLRAIILGLTGVNESTETDPDEAKYSELQKLLQMNGLDKNGNVNYLGNGKVTVEYLMDKKYTNTVLLQKQKNSLDIVLSDDPSSDGFVALSDSNYFPNLVIGFTQGGRAQSYKFDSYEKQRGNIGDVSALLFNAKQEHFEELEQWIFDLDGDSAKNKRAKQILDFVFQVVSGVIGFEIKIDKVEHQRKEIWVKIGKDELAQFNLISQGFTKVFAWIGHFIKRLSECNPDMENFKDAPAILIIDEIDTYLHPKWQRNILAFLAETFTNTQFIVTTHSPLVANYLNPAKIKGGVALYRLERGASEPKKFEKVYGRDLSAIFFDWMGVPNRNPEIDKEIDEILYLIGKETPESLKAAKEKIAKIQMEEYDEIMAEIKSSLEYAEEHLGGE